MADKKSILRFIYRLFIYSLLVVGWGCLITHTCGLGDPEAGNAWFELGVIVLLLGIQLRGGNW